ncbi:DUF72 domain-containing protein [Massilia sp. G4R7]|uniref:DUF72 domain-containing protein n=1 Tax=Massilia phyllostachyos TaxID=2898585 RepID=A0ABS8Q445_9BURK|nr:DUF72 domain-containing protein [Massilia phyllostachyos]MCD2516518.1 DUF72 domain-containing protein [Massilia phyllostachyos]
MSEQAVMSGDLLVGCAGWSLPKQDAAAFPAEGSHLERYAATFPAVEINSSFYRPHKPATYAKWAGCTPEHFRFSVKVPRAITHDARMENVEQQLVQLAHEAGELGEKLGCLLVQLPPKFGFVDATARLFFRQLHDIFGCTVAFEARHPSWFSDAATELLVDSRVVRVIADPAAGQPGPHVPTSADTLYVRLHGTPRIYYSRYMPEYVESVRRELMRQTAAGKTCWCIFDNTAAFEAVPNALELMHGQYAQPLDDAAILARPW